MPLVWIRDVFDVNPRDADHRNLELASVVQIRFWYNYTGNVTRANGQTMACWHRAYVGGEQVLLLVSFRHCMHGVPCVAK